jgi:hypothetical protein
MGVYTRKDSPFLWMLLERRGRRPLRETTGIPARHANPQQVKELRRQAHDRYLQRMNELAHQDTVIARGNGTQTPTVLKPLPRSPDGWCYIYFIQQGALVKIGRTVDVNKRLKTLQTGNSRGFNVLAAVPAHAVIESAIHARFKHLHEQGEWFRLDADLSAFIERAKQGVNPIALLWE